MAAKDEKFTVHHRIPSDPVGDTVTSVMIEHLVIDSDRGADKVTVDDLTGVADLQLITVEVTVSPTGSLGMR